MSLISVEVIYARPDIQKAEVLQLESGTTARQALQQSTLVQTFTEIDAVACPLGVWGAEVADDYRLKNGDRLEIYRPLINDPRETRRRLAAEGKTMGKTIGKGKEKI